MDEGLDGDLIQGLPLVVLSLETIKVIPKTAISPSTIRILYSNLLIFPVVAGVIGYGLPYRGIISTIYQINNAKELGIFRYGGGLSTDLGTSNFGVIVIFPADSYIIQLILGSTRISKRISYDGGVNWSGWAD